MSESSYDPDPSVDEDGLKRVVFRVYPAMPHKFTLKYKDDHDLYMLLQQKLAESGTPMEKIYWLDYNGDPTLVESADDLGTAVRVATEGVPLKFFCSMTAAEGTWSSSDSINDTTGSLHQQRGRSPRESHHHRHNSHHHRHAHGQPLHDHGISHYPFFFPHSHFGHVSQPFYPHIHRTYTATPYGCYH